MDQSTQGDVRAAHERLRQCGADPELIQLAIECLEPAMGKRPRDASHVERRMTAHLESAQERIRQAEIAEESTRAVARFRLIALVIGFALILAGTVTYLRQQARHAEDVAFDVLFEPDGSRLFSSFVARDFERGTPLRWRTALVTCSWVRAPEAVLRERSRREESSLSFEIS